MSEQFKQDAGSNNQEIDDDPLAELARIVAGEPEANPAPQAEVPHQPDLTDASVEQALEEQLMQEFALEDNNIAEVEAPSFIDDINSSIEEVTSAEQPVFEEAQLQEVIPEPFKEASVTPEIPQANVDSEVGFQDGLIDALELEIGGAPEPVAEMPFEAPVEAYEESPQIEPEPAYDVNQAMSEVELNAENIQNTLEQELSGQFETEMAAENLQEPVQTTDAPIASIEDDLGSAFANEFEQMSAQQNTVEEPAYIAPTPEPIETNPIVTEPIVADNAVASDPNLEMDFEAAFAQELEVITSPQTTDGWSENATAEAGAAFSAAVSSEPVMAQAENLDINLSDLDIDPGHAGSVDDITSIEQVAVANDNGGGKKYAVAALVIALFAGVIAAGYGFLGGENTTVASGTPEIIKADAGPIKVKPKDPGGLVPENQDNASYGDLSGENKVAVSQDKLTSETEEPIVFNTGNTDEQPKTDDRLAASEDTGATPSANGSAVLPKVVQTVTVKPDGTIIAKPAVPKPVETALNTVPIVDTTNVVVKPVSTQVITKPNAIDGASTTGDISVPEASPLPKPVVVAKPAPIKQVAAAPKPAAVAPAPTRKSEWVVQVASQRSPEAAQSSFANMRNRYSALQGRAMSIQRANVNGATYYRVRVQTASRSDANQLCSSLTAAGGSCFVTR